MSEPVIIVTNDDGYFAKGIQVLAELASTFAKVVVMAPAEVCSGMSHAISIKDPIRFKKIREENGIPYYACTGTPVDTIKLAISEVMGLNPIMVLSGINHGSNSASSIVYSGTMGAAMEGCLNRIPSVGFSILDWDHDPELDHVKPFIKRIIKSVLEHGLPEGVCLNVNMPHKSKEIVKGIKVVRQNNGYWQEEFDHRLDPSKGSYYWLKGNYHNTEPEAEDTDEWVLANNYISVVPVKVDFTAHNFLNELKQWDF